MGGGPDATVATTREYLQKVFRIRRTCTEMLQDRGYQVIGDQPETFDAFVREHCIEDEGELLLRKAALKMIGDNPAAADPTSDPRLSEAEREMLRTERRRDKVIIVFFVGHKQKLGADSVRVYFQEMVEQGAHRCIVVSPTTPTSQCRLAIQALEGAEEPKVFEVFMESELLVNVCRHELVPRHKPLSVVEKRDLLESLKIRETQLPRIQQADPVARHYGLRRGQVVRITRPSETAGEYVTYRLVQA
eukprot:Hpha_TRINITY_DN32500_c0_g1::TRINITY_DN32500_c0_g1_i1::g.24426::m.24426/K03013/RPB5, POLR2E; DNA-directed RNA polymerases I, II, and III subunit RPABC1